MLNLIKASKPSIGKEINPLQLNCN